ncbi:hypothetical protein IQ230_03890 [Gloeocapsopsis crepidinum LEGE 06123]|uniref:Uncharacterized protein n=1 Tax=Gloeocapsopsis crepidinum LEGE 06123 TaxID=588587 RepID=A0ABR9UPI5_9CHRO|nr:hypothetical protein [Gloeocapsopsis crepidinum]MBE9189520.1 hypothetical protein [Gloeocapsopsis crepidinum LEGE 06123]
MSQVQPTSDLPEATGLVRDLDLGDMEEWLVNATNYEYQAILWRSTQGEWETVLHVPRLMWTDTLSVVTNGYLYVTANQLHRQAKYQKGKDLRQKAYTLFRIRIDAQPVLL